MRSKSASELWTSTPTDRSDWIGKNSRVCSVVKATRVPIEMAPPPPAIDCPANQYTAAGMIAKLI